MGTCISCWVRLETDREQKARTNCMGNHLADLDVVVADDGSWCTEGSRFGDGRG